MTLSKRSIGAWLVHHTRKLDNKNRTSAYKDIRVAGKAGILLSALSENDQATLENGVVNVLASAAGVDTAFELPVILKKLESELLIEVGEYGIEVIGLTSPAILQHTADIFANSTPNPSDQAALSMAELCSDAPQEAESLKEYLADTHKLKKGQASDLLDDAAEIGFSDSEKVGDSTLFFNGSIFRSNDIQKIHRVLASMSSQEQSLVKNFDATLTARGCSTHSEAETMLGKPLLEKLLAIGMYELNEVSNPTEVAVYVMKPSAFCKFGSEPTDDAFELARALVASLTYGMHRSSTARGRIKLINALLGKLIAGGRVGPATAIGEDYKILELKKVVRVFRDGFGFSMQLLKKEIGQIALAAITQGDATDYSLDLPGAAVTTFRGPEEKRMEVRQKKSLAAKQHQIADALQSLRSGR
ncbi:MAG: hypothetical protein WDO74_23705 [Pseudomonadota bacterium]